MPSKHLILCSPLFLLPSIFPSIRVLSHESVLIGNKAPEQSLLEQSLGNISLCVCLSSHFIPVQPLVIHWILAYQIPLSVGFSRQQYWCRFQRIFFYFFYCSGFCHTLKWNSHGFTCVPDPDPPSHLPLYSIPLGLPSAPGPSACLMHPTWAGDLFHPR